MRQRGYLILSFGVLLLFSLVYSACFDQRRHPSRFLIPEGYVGQVRIEFKIKEALPTPIEDGCYMFVIPSSGKLQTSSDLEYGWAKDHYYYYSGIERREINATGWGYGGMIWGGSNGEDNGTENPPSNGRVLYEGFFVGTEDQYRELNHMKPRESDKD